MLKNKYMKNSLFTLFDFKEKKANKFNYPLHENVLNKEEFFQSYQTYKLKLY